MDCFLQRVFMVACVSAVPENHERNRVVQDPICQDSFPSAARQAMERRSESEGAGVVDHRELELEELERSG